MLTPLPLHHTPRSDLFKGKEPLPKEEDSIDNSIDNSIKDPAVMAMGGVQLNKGVDETALDSLAKMISKTLELLLPKKKRVLVRSPPSPPPAGSINISG